VAPQRAFVFYSGTVQGVGFRYTAAALARRYRVTGHVRNLMDRRVELVAEGEKAEVENFLAAVREQMTGLIRREDISWHPATGEYADFGIRF